jgi:hypothetical protein
MFIVLQTPLNLNISSLSSIQNLAVNFCVLILRELYTWLDFLSDINWAHNFLNYFKQHIIVIACLNLLILCHVSSSIQSLYLGFDDYIW